MPSLGGGLAADAGQKAPAIVMLTGLGRRLNDGPIRGLTKRPFSALVGPSNQVEPWSIVCFVPAAACVRRSLFSRPSSARPCLRPLPRTPKPATSRRARSRPKRPRRSTNTPRRSTEIAGPAGNPECVWLGRRVVGLLWRDDLDTAFRHLDLYDRFGCPSAHIQSSFRCIILHGNGIDPKVADSLNGRVQACWINPTNPAPPPAAATPPATASNPAGSH